MKNRKAFNFYRSYYDVAKKLSPEDGYYFLMAILNKQFEDIEPSLDGMLDILYTSQKHSIDAQVEGYKNKIKAVSTPTEGPSEPPTEGPSQGGTEPPSYVSNDIIMTTEPPTEGPSEPPSVQEKEQGQEKEQVKEEKKEYTSIRTSSEIFCEKNLDIEDTIDMFSDIANSKEVLDAADEVHNKLINKK